MLSFESFQTSIRTYICIRYHKPYYINKNKLKSITYLTTPMKKAYLFLACSVFLSLTSCALKAIPSEYTYIKTDMTNVDVNELGKGTV